jgi:hypothetical protein
MVVCTFWIITDVSLAGETNAQFVFAALTQCDVRAHAPRCGCERPDLVTASAQIPHLVMSEQLWAREIRKELVVGSKTGVKLQTFAILCG